MKGIGVPVGRSLALFAQAVQTLGKVSFALSPSD
jgi:hypothetical protein